MLIITEQKLSDFNTWAGANQTKDRLTYEELDLIEEMLTEVYPNGMTDTELNDFLWFDSDTIAEWLGYADFEELMEDEDR